MREVLVMIGVQPPCEIDNTVYFDFSFSYPPSPALPVTFFAFTRHSGPKRSRGTAEREREHGNSPTDKLFDKQRGDRGE